MSEHPKREDHDSDGNFLDAMAKHYGIDPRMIRPLSESDQLRADIGRLNFEIRILEEHIECLTKAGDAMADDLLKEFGRKEMLKDESYQNWLLAKQGKTNE
jgi:hypothetical protein